MRIPKRFRAPVPASRRECPALVGCPASMTTTVSSALLTSVLLTSVLLTGCVTTQMPDRQQLHTNLLWTNETRELSASLWVSPFFRDESRRLLSFDHPSEVELLVTPEGAPISPGEAIEVLPAGTRVTVLSVDFPTTWQTISRPLMTPREQPWLALAVEGRDARTPYIVVLPPAMKTQEEATKVIDRWLAPVGIAAEVAALPEIERRMIADKKLATGVSRRALELAFGPPHTRKVHGEGTSVVEAWTWESDLGTRRTAHLRDGVVERVELPE